MFHQCSLAFIFAWLTLGGPRLVCLDAAMPTVLLSRSYSHATPTRVARILLYSRPSPVRECHHTKLRPSLLFLLHIPPSGSTLLSPSPVRTAACLSDSGISALLLAGPPLCNCTSIPAPHASHLSSRLRLRIPLTDSRPPRTAPRTSIRENPGIGTRDPVACGMRPLLMRRSIRLSAEDPGSTPGWAMAWKVSVFFFRDPLRSCDRPLALRSSRNVSLV